MKAYKLNIKTIVVIVGILSLVIYSLVLVIFHIAKTEDLGETLLHYGYIIAPVSILWVMLDRYLWHTRLFQVLRKSLNIPPDLRGRWEGKLENSDGSPAQKFVIEVRQTLTSLKVHSYSAISPSLSILCEIATDTHEENFTLCFLWEGQTHTDIKDMHQGIRFQGYTMLNLLEHEKPRMLKGSYFTNFKPNQTKGGIELAWVSKEIKGKFE
ncbi:MAG: hypothetical protein IT214_13990 [Chitinophagaceae bacterium]|jgi:hypothetical protein|nr:hypothetical protein [Chitinophagaceae bacterium]OQY96181.1 MAG: hypothetical protein B6D37_03445 [Sphingobacteriales bacterium UTBCD1]